MSGNNVLTCAYCGQRYQDGTPTTKHKLLNDHIRECEDHPLRQAEIKIKTLRAALEGVVGASTEEELCAIERLLPTLSASDADKRVSVNAIKALKMCLQHQES